MDETSDGSSSGAAPPPPGAVFELAERAVDFVRRAVGLTLDYTSETLPLLDHYLGAVPRDRPEMIELIAAAAGAYFGEVARRALGGSWENLADDAPQRWQLVTAAGIRFSPVGMAAEAVVHEDLVDFDGAFDVPDADRAAVEDALSERDVAEDEFYSLGGRLEALLYVQDIILARRKPPADEQP